METPVQRGGKNGRNPGGREDGRGVARKVASERDPPNEFGAARLVLVWLLNIEKLSSKVSHIEAAM